MSVRHSIHEKNVGFERKCEKPPSAQESLILGMGLLSLRATASDENPQPAEELFPKKNTTGGLWELKHQESKDERMSRLSFNRRLRSQDGSQDVHQDRISKRQDVELAQESFYRYFPQKTGNPFNMKRLVEALADFGVKARARVEKLELAQVIDVYEEKSTLSFGDFCQIVKKGRGKIRHANRFTVSQACNNLYTERMGVLSPEQTMMMGVLSPEQAMMIMEEMSLAPRLGTHERSIMEAAIRELHSDSNGLIAYNEVGILISQAHEQHEAVRRRCERDIRTKYNLSPRLFAEFRDQILEFEESFRRADDDGSGSLDMDEIMNILSDFGLKTSAEEVQKQMDHAHSHALVFAQIHAVGMSFPEFLVLIRVLRSYDMEQKKDDIEALFKSHDKDRNGQLDMKEICQILVELGLQPKTPKEQVGIAQLIEEVDSDGSGKLDLQEFLLMEQRIGEKVMQMRCAQDTDKALSLGFPMKMVYALRNAFAMLDEDCDGVLSHHNLERAVHLMGWRLASSKLTKIIHEVDEYESGGLDFNEFLPFMQRVEREFKQLSVQIGRAHV